MTVSDRVVFLMPRSMELQFPAMSTVQAFVNGYEIRSRASDVSGGAIKYRLLYDVHMPPADWFFFLDAGFKVVQAPSPVAEQQADMVVDLRDERLMRFYDTGRHAGQACGLMAGIEVPPVIGMKSFGVPYKLPKLRQVRSLLSRYPTIDGNWLLLEGSWLDNGAGRWARYGSFGEEQCILQAKDEEWAGVIGQASRGTYLAVCMGVPTVEIYPEDRPKKWLSKWGFPGYRMVDGPEKDWEWQIRAAVASLKAQGVSEVGEDVENAATGREMGNPGLLNGAPTGNFAVGQVMEEDYT